MSSSENAMQRDRATFEKWLAEHASATETEARRVAQAFINRAEPRIRRKAINNTLRTYLGEKRARKCFEKMLGSGVIVLERGSSKKPQPADLFSIDYNACSAKTMHKTVPLGKGRGSATSSTPAVRPTITTDNDCKIRYAKQLRDLDAWLDKASRREPAPATREQRAYDIFDSEKALNIGSQNELPRLISQLGISDELLGIVCLNKTKKLDTFIPHGAKGPIIVVENADSFETLRYILGQRRCTHVLGMTLGGVIFGEGTNICSPKLLDNTLKHIGYTMDYVYYWGDIDRAGIRELVDARKANTTQIKLARPFYHKMIQLQKKRIRTGHTPEHASNQSFTKELEMVARELPITVRWAFLKAIREGGHIPQEIIPLGKLIDV